MRGDGANTVIVAPERMPIVVLEVNQGGHPNVEGQRLRAWRAHRYRMKFRRGGAMA